MTQRCTSSRYSDGTVIWYAGLALLKRNEIKHGNVDEKSLTRTPSNRLIVLVFLPMGAVSIRTASQSSEIEVKVFAAEVCILGKIEWSMPLKR